MTICPRLWIGSEQVNTIWIRDYLGRCRSCTAIKPKHAKGRNEYQEEIVADDDCFKVVDWFRTSSYFLET